MTETKDSRKVLVAYFSATGTTRNVARDIADILDAPLFEITPEKPYTSADLDWTDSTSRSSIEMHDPASRPAVAGKVDDITQYDTILLGYPIWWYIAPTIVNTFIENNDLTGKTVVCFATSGGSPITPCVEALRRQYPNINWTEGRLLNNPSRQTLTDWLRKLGL